MEWRISVGLFRPKYMDHLQRWSRIFRWEETETDLSIWNPTEISGIFVIKAPRVFSGGENLPNEMSAGAGFDFALALTPHSDFLLTKRFEPLRMIARWSLFMGKLLKVRNAAERKEDVRSVNTEQECSHTKLSIVNNSNRLVYFWITALSSRLSCIN